MTKNTLVTLVFAISASFTLACGGGSDPNGTGTNTGTNTGVCTATGSGAAADCITTGTDTNTATGTGGVVGTGGTGSVSGTGGAGSTTGTGGTGSATGTSTGTTVTIPDWFKIGNNLGGDLLNTAGSIYASIAISPTKINSDGTFTANVVQCKGNCVSIGSVWTGTISASTFTISNISAVGVIPTNCDPYAHTSGTWSWDMSSGTFCL